MFTRRSLFTLFLVIATLIDASACCCTPCPPLPHAPCAGHNIADVAAEAASFSINTETIAVAIKELDKCLKVTENSAALSAALSAGAAAGATGAFRTQLYTAPSRVMTHAAADSGIGDPEELKLNCAIAKGVMLKLEACLDAIHLAPSPQPQPCPSCSAAMPNQSLVCPSCSSIRKRWCRLPLVHFHFAFDFEMPLLQRPHSPCASSRRGGDGRKIKSGRLCVQRSALCWRCIIALLRFLMLYSISVLLIAFSGAAHDAPSAIFDGEWLIDVFFKAACVTRENVLDLHNILQGIQQKFAAISHIANVNLVSIGNMQQVLQQAFDIGCRNDASQVVELLATEPQQHKYFKAFAQLLLNGGVSLSYWCFSPGVTIRAIVKEAKCIILASGTLAPLQSWESELRVPFPVRLEGAHVVARSRLWCGVFPTGPSGKRLDSSFNNRDNTEYLDELGALICNACKVVPHGVLAFFGSYSALERAVAHWQHQRLASAAPSQATVWSRLSKVKSIVVEPRDGRTLVQSLDAYKAACDDSLARRPGAMGGLFLGVCRGKASEGLNFSDHYGRAVIICGVPFPSSVDPRVKLKRQFLVEERSRSSDSKSFAQTADDW